MKQFFSELKNFPRKCDWVLLLLCLLTSGFGMICMVSATQAEKFGGSMRYVLVQSAGIVLGLGRAIGETMAVVMIAGNQPRIPGSILDGVRTLTTNIVLEMGYAADLHRDALIATAVVLFVFLLAINLVFAVLNARSQR